MTIEILDGAKSMSQTTEVFWPRWIKDIERMLPIRSQFVMSGNIRDVFITPTTAGNILAPFMTCLWSCLESHGYEFLLVYDRIDGIKVYPQSPVVQDKATQLVGLKLQDGLMAVNLDTLVHTARKAISLKSVHAGLVIDFASRLTTSPQTPESAEYKFFVAMEKLSLIANPILAKSTNPLFNAVFWLLNRAQDIPSWFPMDSERISSIVVAHPDYESRFRAASVLAPLFKGYDDSSQGEKRDFALRLADGTDGMSLQALVDITQLARGQNISLKEVEDAVRCFKVGATDNPWRKNYLKNKIRAAQNQIEKRVKGQKQATIKAIDILMRSVMGLTGAQARVSGGRPRGVLFFAGPTGVGKTELAKTLTELLFGDEQACIRFDMSEFAEEHAAARMLGAPPGYVGYEAGGELTNAVKQRPFSVILFDEIEKAHPRLLDKFLQILEDGRLTDGRGNTVYFSESVIIFTSNLGIFVEGEDGERIQNVKPSDPYEVVERKIRQSIENHFKFHLSRPELLNRIGDNIVVFNFISPDIAQSIFDGMLANVTRRVQTEHKLELEIVPATKQKLAEWCTEDLSNGGRGIGNRLESTLINPLARALFEYEDRQADGKATIVDIVEQDHVYSVLLS